MTTIETFLKEMEQEAVITRKMLGRIPNDKYDWKPHERSMSMRQLGTHVAELPGWAAMAIHTDGLDFDTAPYNPPTINETGDLLNFFEKTHEDAKAVLQNAREVDLNQTWILRAGETILAQMTKGEVIRMSISQIIHHRAQLGVYLRLLNIPIPGSYGPSADEQ